DSGALGLRLATWSTDADSGCRLTPELVRRVGSEAAPSRGGLAVCGLTFRRLRPPLRPRRRLERPGAPPDAAGSVAGMLSDAMAVNAAAVCSKGSAGSGAGTGAADEVTSGAVILDGDSPPKRAAASWALVFHSERRKRSAAVEYHFAASAL